MRITASTLSGEWDIRKPHWNGTPDRDWHRYQKSTAITTICLSFTLLPRYTLWRRQDGTPFTLPKTTTLWLFTGRSWKKLPGFPFGATRQKEQKSEKCAYISYLFSEPSSGASSSGGLCPQSSPGPPQTRIILPKHDLLGEEMLTSLSEEKGLDPVPQWAFIGFSLHRNTGHICKAHQSLSVSNDQTIDNIQRTMRVYSESGSDR